MTDKSSSTGTAGLPDSDASTRNDLWKVYIWTCVVMSAMSYPYITGLRPFDFWDMAVSVWAYSGLYLFIWKRPVKKPALWKACLPVFVATVVLSNLVFPVPDAEGDRWINAGLTLVFFVPALIALYAIGFRCRGTGSSA